ncbi:hypothetical protein [Streptomyces sp. BE230]|uniref:hypothetical protein n=1 Tax=Streptomyces sp. BE230 TaxID=3002526 RepID=UPI002ECFDA70|nr:hypothetical protein [Streptomyces sp. BE230]
MTLRVKAADLDSYAKMIDRAGADALAGKKYIDNYGPIDSGPQGLFHQVFGTHESILPKVVNVFHQMNTILDASATELSKSATYYRRVEHAQAEKMDSTLPKTKR